jgi:hypothetical protein
MTFWTGRKKVLDQCLQYVMFESSAQQTLDWMTSTGELYLSSQPHQLGSSRQATEALLQENNEFKASAKVKGQSSKHNDLI